MNQDDSEAIQKSFFEAKNNKNQFYYSEYRITTKEGKVKWIHDSVRILYDESDVLIGFQGVILEITKQKESTMDLKLFKAVSDLSVQGNVITDLKGNITYVNSFFAHLHGYEIEELLGKSEFLFYPDQQVSPLKQLMEPGTGIMDFGPVEIWHQHKDGSPIPLMASGVIITDFNNIPRYISISAIDLTHRKQIELQLRQSQKMESIGTLAGGIAHDFNNILFPILSCAEMLKEEVSEDELIREHIDEIYTSAIRARDLVKQILTFSRHEEFSTQVLGIQPMLKETLKLIRSSIPASIEIFSNIDETCKPIHADPTQIHQLLMNILTNAYQSIGSKIGRLSIDLTSEQIIPQDWGAPQFLPGEYNCIAISDTGDGMEAETLSRIFEPFFTTKDKGHGTGLGLSVVHGIVQSMKGFIHVTSEKGSGTLVRVFLPIVDEILLPSEGIGDISVTGGNEHILIIDDEKTILKIEERILTTIGYGVTPFSSSLKALDHFRSNSEDFDLVISDMTMPEMLGDKLALELLNIRPDIPVIICSGYSENASKESLSAIGVDGFISKPLLKHEFTSKIRSVLDKAKGFSTPVE